MEAPQFYEADTQLGHQEKRQIHNYSPSHAGDNFAVEDLLDFSNEDAPLADAAALDAVNDSAAALDTCNSSLLPAADVATDNGHFSGDLGVPYEELAELEWLSNFVEESFSSERPAVAGKARSKRSRGVACKWMALSAGGVKARKKESSGGEGRRCVHCATDKTPQWRTGPMGPKTLCNACGVRYKSGRLVPEYRPAASPTFVLTKHSNSHRKVMELRRQKEIMMNHHHNVIFHANDDYLIHQHDFRQLI